MTEYAAYISVLFLVSQTNKSPTFFPQSSLLPFSVLGVGWLYSRYEQAAKGNNDHSSVRWGVNSSAQPNYHHWDHWHIQFSVLLVFGVAAEFAGDWSTAGNDTPWGRLLQPSSTQGARAG